MPEPKVDLPPARKPAKSVNLSESDLAEIVALNALNESRKRMDPKSAKELEKAIRNPQK